MLLRSHTYKEIDLFTQMGAKEVVQRDFEAALELGSHVLKTLGAEKTYIQTVINQIRQGQYLSIRTEQRTLTPEFLHNS
jgi:CPA2 family monovalent cation:H+ antiporter-2